MNKKTFKIPVTYVPKEAFHPGQYLDEELVARGMKQKELAFLLGIAPSALNEIISGKRNISPLLAIKLEAIWGIRAETWVRLQAQYELDTLRIAQKASYTVRKAPSESYAYVSESKAHYVKAGKQKKRGMTKK